MAARGEIYTWVGNEFASRARPWPPATRPSPAFQGSHAPMPDAATSTRLLLHPAAGREKGPWNGRHMFAPVVLEAHLPNFLSAREKPWRQHDTKPPTLANTSLARFPTHPQLFACSKEPAPMLQSRVGPIGEFGSLREQCPSGDEARHQRGPVPDSMALPAVAANEQSKPAF